MNRIESTTNQLACDPWDVRLSSLGQGLDINVLIVTNGNYFADLIIEPFLNRLRVRNIAILDVTGDYRGRTGLSSALWLTRRTALSYLIYKIAVIYCTKAGQLIGGIASRHRSLRTARQTLNVSSITSVAAAKFIEAFNPDVLVSISCPQRIPAQLLRLARICTLNIHSSMLPRYAGLAPYYWVLVNNETSTGTTVHYMTENFDDGGILSQRTVAIERGESALSLFFKLAHEGGCALIEGVTAALAGHEGVPQALSNRSYYSHPDWRSYWKLKRNGFSLARLRDLVRIMRDSA